MLSLSPRHREKEYQQVALDIIPEKIENGLSLSPGPSAPKILWGKFSTVKFAKTRSIKKVTEITIVNEHQIQDKFQEDFFFVLKRQKNALCLYAI